jgi:ATP-dependent HslUV protease ATP-binding subunit HslU
LLIDQFFTHFQLKEKYKDEAAKRAEERILDGLLGGGGGSSKGREEFRKLLHLGDLEEREIDVQLPEKAPSIKPGSLPSEEMQGQILANVFQLMGRGNVAEKKMKIKDCRAPLEEVELDKLLNNDKVIKEAIRAVEEDGIVFIDEIDKICTGAKDYGHDASAEGVQRDLLPLIEGTTINTKYGNIRTDHILFVASGAFHSVKPSDMLAELQGRLPIRVELKGLSEEDLYRILKEPEHNILKQNIVRFFYI